MLQERSMHNIYGARINYQKLSYSKQNYYRNNKDTQKNSNFTVNMNISNRYIYLISNRTFRRG